MIARVTLELALRREFDYLIPPEMADQVEVGSRVQVPLGSRKVLGCVTALAEASDHARLKPILKIIGAQSLVTPKVLQLARWIGEYYCCPPEIALKSVLPEAVRHEQAGWRERLYVRALPVTGAPPKLAKRQKEIFHLIEQRRELPLRELLGTGPNDRRDDPAFGKQGPRDHCRPDFRAGSLRPRTHPPQPTSAPQPRPGPGPGGDQSGDGRAACCVFRVACRRTDSAE